MTSTIGDHLYFCFAHQKWYITKRQLHMLLLVMIALSQATATGLSLHDDTQDVCGVSDKAPNHRMPRKRNHFMSLFLDLFEKEKSSHPENNAKNSYRQGRIIQGEEADQGAWPWQVSVRLNIPGFGNIGHWCGGVLIYSNWVLTSAHCVKNKLVNTFKNAKFSVVYSNENRQGSSNRPSFNLKDEGIGIENIYINDGFAEYQHDIALLKLSENKYTSHLSPPSPVCLPINNGLSTETFLGIRCVATGWGQMAVGGKLQTKLREVELRVIDNKHCRDMYGLMHNIAIQNYHLCAGPILQGGKGTCIGDSGGPLHCNMKDGKWYLAGLTSFGSGCAKPGFPDVFMRITSYNKWIQDTIDHHEKV